VRGGPPLVKRESCFTLESRYQESPSLPYVLQLSSLVAVDEAECNNHSHPAETDQSQNEPLILEASRYDAAEEQRSVAGTSSSVLAL